MPYEVRFIPPELLPISYIKKNQNVQKAVYWFPYLVIWTARPIDLYAIASCFDCAGVVETHGPSLVGLQWKELEVGVTFIHCHAPTRSVKQQIE